MLKAFITEAHTIAKRLQNEALPWQIQPPTAQNPTWNAQQVVTAEAMVWRIQHAHPLDPNQLIERMYDLGDVLEIYTKPIAGSELEKGILKNLGGPFGFRYRIPMSQVVYIASMASLTRPNKTELDDWHQLLTNAEAIAESVEDGEEPEGSEGDEEEEEEEEGEEVPPPPGTAPPSYVPSLPSIPQPQLPPTPPNGQNPS